MGYAPVNGEEPSQFLKLNAARKIVAAQFQFTLEFWDAVKKSSRTQPSLFLGFTETGLACLKRSTSGAVLDTIAPQFLLDSHSHYCSGEEGHTRSKSRYLKVMEKIGASAASAGNNNSNPAANSAPPAAAGVKSGAPHYRSMLQFVTKTPGQQNQGQSNFVPGSAAIIGQSSTMYVVLQ